MGRLGDPATESTDPNQCDTDRDDLGDGLELGMNGGRPSRTGTEASCQQRDADPGSGSNPNRLDTDKDGRNDADEDPNLDGRVNARWDGYSGTQTTPRVGPTGRPQIESSPSDADTDDDGVSDVNEVLQNMNALSWDMDWDGLSDGLETGATDRVKLDNSYVSQLGIPHTRTDVQVLGLSNWFTWQPFQGASDAAGPITTNVNARDTDADGIIDGLEDVNHDGILGNVASSGATCYLPGATGCLSELNANLRDTDNDGIMDGRELMVWGSYSFREAVAQWGGSFAHLAFDGGNRFETDPRNPNTDADAVPGFPDIAPDGLDIFPRGDGMLSLRLGTYQSDDKIDACFGDCAWKVDLALSIQLDTPVGRFSFNTLPIDEWYTRHSQSFASRLQATPQDLFDDLSVSAPQKSVRKVMWDAATAPTVFSFDLPDVFDAAEGGWTPTTKVVVSIWGQDNDWGGSDAVDLSERAGERGFVSAPTQDYDLASGLGDPERMAPKTLIANGAADRQNENKEDDGIMTTALGNNLVPYFWQPLLNRAPGSLIAPPANALDCFGGLTKQGESCA